MLVGRIGRGWGVRTVRGRRSVAAEARPSVLLRSHVRGAAALLWLAGVLLAVACRDSSNPAESYGETGPHAVGVEQRSIQHTDSTGRQRTLDTTIWYPARRAPGQRGGLKLVPRPDAAPASGGPFPVLVFSHGSGGVPEQSLALTTHLASHGFVVAAPPHPGNTLRDCPFTCLELGQIRASLEERPADVRAVLDELARLNDEPGGRFEGRLALDRAGVLGHSLGGATAALVAADEPRVRAALLLAPAVLPEVTAAAARIALPTAIINGDRDILTPVAGARRLYDALPDTTPRALATVEGGDHLVFARRHEGVNRYAAAFFRLYLSDDGPAITVFDHGHPAPDTRLERVDLGR
jgi:predicted dienelactone hydrolase